ncbi:MAG: undecaprenyl-diphosphate phosphatase [Actinomycetota bacterium]|nr:undecaprenyl-diphosphate phosphatase [Actinomycetota bacterium]MDQ3352005.1 undecaprenyl-diphosphate phosphatase [Actinomycetota bacterium]
MPITHAIVLGLVQGLSEFLPISSSGHLLLVPWLFGWKDFESESVEKSFDVALHIGTVFAAIAYFRHDLVRYVREGLALLVRRERPATQDGKLAWLLIVSTIPAAAVGALFESQIDERLGTPTIIAVSLIVFGLVLALADRVVGHRRVESYTARDALLVGAAQAIALNPGTSRSGITMTAARLRGFDRQSAARLSFLMMIPVTTGAVLLKMVGLIAEGIPDGLHLPMVVGVVTSGLAGWFAVWGTIRFVQTRSFTPFVIYRVALGIAVLVIVAAGWR